MSVENKVPAIRFLGFSGEWQSSELGKLLDITSAARVHKNEWTDSGVPFFRTSDVVSIYKGLENTKAYISIELYKELVKKVGAVKKDDLLITGGGSIGIPYLIKTNEPMYFKDADLLWLKNTTNTNGYLLFTFFSCPPFRKYISSITHIGTISHYTIEQAKATPIYISQESEEQTKIGNYFQQLDTLIAQHQQKYDKLLNLKKALLEKMFPKQGATEPEVRFKGFSGDWEEKALGEIGYFNSGVGFPENEQNGKLGIPYFKVSDMNIDGNQVIMNSANNYVNEVQIARLNYKPINEKSIIFAKVGAAIFLERKRIAENFLIDNNMMAFLTTENVGFIKLWFDSISLSKHAQVGALPSYNASDLKIIELCVPHKKEQTKIGNLFKQLDTLISQHQTQLKKLGNIKQACLEKMFV